MAYYFKNYIRENMAEFIFFIYEQSIPELINYINGAGFDENTKGKLIRSSADLLRTVSDYLLDTLVGDDEHLMQYIKDNGRKFTAAESAQWMDGLEQTYRDNWMDEFMGIAEKSELGKKNTEELTGVLHTIFDDLYDFAANQIVNLDNPECEEIFMEDMNLFTDD